MNTAFRAIAAKILAITLACSLLFVSSGCLPLYIYDNLQETETTQEQPREPQIEIETQGEYNDLDFEELCAVLFEYEVTWDSLTFNQLIADSASYDIEAPRPATHGDYSYEANKDDLTFYAEILEALTGGHTVDRDALDAEQARTAQVVETTLQRALESGDTYFYFFEPLSPSTGAQASLPLNLMDYSFRTIDDIEIYLELLEDTPRYFEQLIAHEWKKKDLNLLMSTEAMEDSIEEARAYTGDASDHLLTTTFDEMLDKALEAASGESDLKRLSDGEVEDYKNQNLKAVESAIIPAYTTLLASLEELLPHCKAETSLYDYENGTLYYELQMQSMGFVQSPTSAIDTLEDTLDGYIETILSGSEEPTWENLIPSSVVEAIGDDPKDYISYVQNKSAAEFAPAGELSYEIKIAPDDSPNDYSMAYFMLPPVDDPQINYIVYFPRNISDEVELFSTMAHEAYPGHMYQVYAYSVEDPLAICKVYGSTAYMEGWAMYAQGRAMHYLDADKKGIEAYVAYEKFMYGLYARVDLGVNYEGWSVSDTEKYLSDWGFEAAGKEMYEVVIKQPVSYLAYGLGVIEFDQLKERATTQLGAEFDAVAYHQFITSLGALPFDMLECEFEAWLRTTETKEI